MKLSDYIVSFLEERGVSFVFGYIGGMITHLVDSLDKNPNIRFIQTYHEQTAAIAAEGYALGSGSIGVAICTSGPGVTNMMTGIADAYFGSVPVLYITGQVNTYEYKYNKPVRQQGFQETDVVSIVKPVTKYARLIDKAEDIRYELEKAIYLATTGRKGPVVLDLPMNISRAEIDPLSLHAFEPDSKEVSSFDFTDVICLLEKAERPLLLLGAGCRGSEDLISEFITKTQLPVITSLMGRGVIDETYIHYIGMIGSYGNRCANMSLSKADLLIALGTRLDTRQTGAKLDAFLPAGKIIHVDIDPDELVCHRLDRRIQVNLDVQNFLSQLNAMPISYRSYAIWHQWLEKVVNLYNQNNEIERFVENKSPYRFMQVLSELTEENDILTTDIGQNQMWAAQTLRLKKGQWFVTSGGLAPMGFSLPAAIGLAFAHPDKTIYCINGDGGFHMAVQSLLLISQYRLNIKVIVLNNEALGMITQFQHLYFDDKMAGTTKAGGYLVPNIAWLSKAYSFPYIKISEENLKPAILKKILADPFVLIDYQISGLTTVSPKLEYDKPIEQPIPLLDEAEFNAIMNLI